MPLYERADLRFVWNGHLLREFSLQPELHKFCLPLLHGCILIIYLKFTREIKLTTS